MKCSRRAFLKQALGGAVAAATPAATVMFLGPGEAMALVGDSKVRWTFLVDTEKCVGCGLCVTTCPTEAILLIKKPEDQQYVPPKSGMETYIRIAKERGKI